MKLSRTKPLGSPSKNLHTKYPGSALRIIRAAKGVGRPPKA